MKTKKLFVFGILFAVFLFVGAEDAFAANWYVATNGNDSNSGSQSAPFRTIQRCANVAQAGDTCLVSAGTYNENISTVRSGTASGKIYIKGASGKPIASGFNINHAYTVVDGFMIDGAAASVSVNPGGNNCEILNNDFRNVENGIEMDRGNTTGPSGCLIRGNKFYGNTTVSVMVGLGGQGHIIEGNDFGPLVMHEDAFRPFGFNHIIRGNTFHDIRSGGTGGHMDIFQAWGPIGNLTFERNFVRDWPGQAWMIDCPQAGRDELITIRNNVFSNVNSAGQSYCPRTLIYNNTFANSGEGNGRAAMIRSESGRGLGTNSRIQNNIFYYVGYSDGSAPAYTVDSGAGGFVSSNNLAFPSRELPGGTGSVIENPQFVSGTDFHLSASSPGINKGASPSGVREDITCKARPQGSAYDIGAYEYGGGDGSCPISISGGGGGGGGSGGDTPPPSQPALKMAVPAYFSPTTLYDRTTTLWSRMVNQSPPATGFVIMNPSNGPGTSLDADYLPVLASVKDKGVKVIGYVETMDAMSRVRGANLIKTEIDSYTSWYGVDGIFFDEAASDDGHIPFYQDLANYVKSKISGGIVVLNPGVVPAEGYMNVADVVVIFESSYYAYRSAQFLSWGRNYPSSKIAHLVHDTPTSSDMTDALRLARERNAGYVYVTNDWYTSNPWDSLPTYWTEELSEMLKNSSGENKPPSVSITSPQSGAPFPTAPATVRVSASASDSDGIQRVDFFRNNVFQGTANQTTSPFNYDFGLTAGSYILKAVAYDLQGGSASAFISVTVGSVGSSCTPPYFGASESALADATADPCPVLSVSNSPIDSGDPVVITLAPQNSAQYIYKKIFVSNPVTKTWVEYPHGPNCGSDAWCTMNEGIKSLVLDAEYISDKLGGSGTHYVASWDWTYDSSKKCWFGPGSTECNKGSMRLQKFVVQEK